MCFKQLKTRRNESGMILVTILLLTIVLSILTVSIMSINVGQVKTSRSIVDSIRAKELAIGAYYQYHTQKLSGNGTIMNGTSESMYDESVGKSYTVSISDLGTLGNTTPNNTNKINVTINY